MRSNIELKQLYKKPDIVAIPQYRRVGHVRRSNCIMRAALKRGPYGKKTTRQITTKLKTIDQRLGYEMEKHKHRIGMRGSRFVLRQWASVAFDENRKRKRLLSVKTLKKKKKNRCQLIILSHVMLCHNNYKLYNRVIYCFKRNHSIVLHSYKSVKFQFLNNNQTTYNHPM